MHSWYSDGSLAPKDIVSRSSKQDLSAIALTDHNCIDGVLEAMQQGKKKGVRVIAGVELYTEYKGHSLHLLGYGIDFRNAALVNFLIKAQRHHLAWAQKTLLRLRGLGFEINLDGLSKTRSRYIGFRHIKGVMMTSPKNRKKISASLFDFINQYFIKGKPAFIPGMHLQISTPEAIRLVKRSGGLAVLAHPGQQLSWQEDNRIIQLQKAGLSGIETLSPYHAWHQVEHYQLLAAKHRLLTTGGSDFHGDLESKGEWMVKSASDYFKVPNILFKQLERRLKEIK
jgi:hypothetical protein